MFNSARFRAFALYIPTVVSCLFFGSATASTYGNHTNLQQQHSEEVLLAVSNDIDDTDRMLYDRNKRLITQQRERRAYNRGSHPYDSRYNYGSREDDRWEREHQGEEPMYYEPDEHPDAAGDEDR